MNQEEFLTHIAQALEAADIPFMVAGSHSSSYHGEPRATNDVDLVIDPSREQLDQFLGSLGDRYYVSREAAHDAHSRRAMFNVIDFAEGLKADLIVRKDRPFSIEELRRRQMGILYGRLMPITSPEDVILTKLEWNKISPSERQVKDASNVAIVQGSKLDQPYLRKWASALGVTEQLEEVLQTAKEFPPGDISLF